MPARTANALLQPGAQINRYKVVRRLAEGGFGVVYEGRRDDGKEVAIKEFLPSLIPCRRVDDHGLVSIGDRHQSERFEKGLAAFFREADTLSRIHDERIIAIWDVFKANGTGYFAMPMEKGYTFHTIMKAQRWLGDGAARRLFVEAAHGVEVLHQSRVLHLDIKPVNLWLRPDGQVVLLDLGASRWADDEAEIQHLARTPGFAAPEQHGPSRHAVLDERTDVYGLAASLRACLDGASPPPAPSRQVGESSAPHHWGRRSTRLLQVMDQGMALDPQNRFQTIADFRRALEDIPRLDNVSPWHADLDDGAPDVI
jgi:serine/threonine protein kinase